MIEPSPADHRAAEGHEGLMDVVAPIIADAQPSELVQQGEGLFHDVAVHPQSAAVLGVAPGQGGDLRLRIVEASRTVSADRIDVSALDRYLEAA